ncbi:hypothetical protein [Flavobacterium ajazii]|uniref:hypothetical protein n=1 Tax=Flavobacterium ajazii TaxID=2692318 RepID=UPI0013CFCA0A|nr:hypothetical protein [Flavobacterium ajazii]
MEIRLVFFFLLITIMSFSQEKLEIESTFMIKGKKMSNVNYYIIENDKAFILDKIGDKIIIDSEKLKIDKLKLLMKYQNNIIEFFINPKEIFYLKIVKMPFSFKSLFKCRYVISQGFDYKEIVTSSKKIYDFKPESK